MQHPPRPDSTERRKRRLAPGPPSPSLPPSALDEADTTLADTARRRLHERGIVPIEPDPRIATILGAGERLVSIRTTVALERRREGDEPPDPLVGDLYLTTSRLVHLGAIRVDVPLAAIREAVLATGALRLLVGEGRGVEILVPDPRRLRVELAAVRELARAAIADRAVEGTSAGPSDPRRAEGDPGDPA